MTAHQSGALTGVHHPPHPGPAVPAARNAIGQPQSHNGLPLPAVDPLIEHIIRSRFAGHSEFDRLSHAFGAAAPTASSPASSNELVDFLFLTDKDPHDPGDVFDRLRWGGQVVVVSRNRARIEAAAKSFANWRTGEAAQRAWLLEQPMGKQHRYLFNLRILGLRTPVYYLVARKVMLVPPGRTSDRFTYHVYIQKNPTLASCDVVKEVPTIERVLGRLREKFPDADEETLRRRARKFTDKIFPVFLTRETAMLKLLQRDLPKKFRNRVPRVLAGETDPQGYVRGVRMNWLRNAPPRPEAAKGGPGRPLTQLQFAHQAAELLAALHDDAGVMHLDLRLDNIVITEHGVGFVDFGSAVRVGEEFPDASLLSNLFEEMMRTSQIQRMLGKMTENGQVTSEEITSCHQRVDKAVDFFYLAVQINAPLTNPDFKGLVLHDPESAEAREIAALTEKILRPTPDQPARFTSAKDILRGLEEIAARLNTPPHPAS